MDVLQRRVSGTVRLVVDHRVAVEEGTATGVFARQANRNAFINQRGVSEVFRAAPVEQFLTGSHCLAIAINLGNARLHFNCFRHRADAFSQFLQALHLNFVRVLFVPFVVEVRRPGERVHVHRTPLCYHAIASIQRIAVQVNHLGGIFQRRHFFLLQLVSVDFARRRMFFDFLIHQRLGCARLVGFVVAVTAVAHQVNEDITFKGVTEIERQTGHKGNGFRIIRVNVENRCLNHLTDISTVRCRTGIQRIRGGETNLVVDNDTYRTANFITTRFRHVQGFLNHALPGHCGVTVDGDWQHFVAARLIKSVQTGTNRADNYRAYNLKVRRVKRQRQVHQAAIGLEVRREAHVVFHVTRAEVFFMFTGKLVEQVLRFFTQHVHQHVQTTTVRHPENHFPGAAVASVADHLFKHRD